MNDNETDESNENITVWDDPNSIVQTVHGNVTFRKWCELEMERWAKAGKKTQLFTSTLSDGREQICIGRA